MASFPFKVTFFSFPILQLFKEVGQWQNEVSSSLSASLRKVKKRWTVNWSVNGLLTGQFVSLCPIAKCSFSLFRCNVYFPADHECVTAPFLKQSECTGSNCIGLLKSRWHRIKCFPFSTSGSKGLCSNWCHEGGTSTQPCCNTFHKFSSDQIYFNNSDEKLKFEVVHCRSFEFKIRLKSMDPSKYFTTLFLFDPFYFVVLFLLLFLLLVIIIIIIVIFIIIIVVIVIIITITIIIFLRS